MEDARFKAKTTSSRLIVAKTFNLSHGCKKKYIYIYFKKISHKFGCQLWLGMFTVLSWLHVQHKPSPGQEDAYRMETLALEAS